MNKRTLPSGALRSHAHGLHQAIGVGIQAEAQHRAVELAAGLEREEAALREALKEFIDIRNRIANPESILGSPATKHGEIAEYVEVGVRNARSLIEGNGRIAHFDGVSRTGPVDYVLDGANVQSKFINGTRNGLEHVLEHMSRYESFVQDGKYVIPRDQHDQIIRVMRGEEVEGLSEKTLRTIRAKVSEIEQLSGREFETLVKPSISEYAEVQQGRVAQTLIRHEEQITARNIERREALHERAKPSLEGVGGAIAAGAAAGAALSLALALYTKCQVEDKGLADLSWDDWKDLLGEAAKGGGTGGISAGAIYALTNFYDLTAPFAAAVVSTTFGVKKLWDRYKSGEIDFERFVALGQWTCLEAGVVAAMTAAGQLIPVPIVGGLIGAAAGRVLVAVVNRHFGEESEALRAALAKQYEELLTKLDSELRETFEGIMAKVERLGDLTRAAFDLELNVQLRLAASVDLARAYGVPETDILHSTDELDQFMRE